MKIGESVRHRTRHDCGIGRIVEIYPDGYCNAVFSNHVFSGIRLDTLLSAEDEVRTEHKRHIKEQVLSFLNAGDYDSAEALFRERCANWWNRNDYEATVARAKEDHARRLADAAARHVAEQRESLRRQVQELLDSFDYTSADRIYQQQCVNWWMRADYDAARAEAQYVEQFAQIYQTGSLAELDTHFQLHRKATELSTDDFVGLKLPKLRATLAAIGLSLDEDQERANARPETRLLIKARAGSGKTRTLCARAALAIRDEKLDPNQVLILAFNKAAAAEIKHRVQKMVGIDDYENARTFHSLAFQLVKPTKKLLFNAGGHPSARQQSGFVERMMQRILNPAFKEAMVEFFKKELEQIETIGRDLPEEEYFVFRRALEHFTLKGDRVKSNGEKFISDFLFEHGVEYRYERAWAWKSPFLDGATYKPDFSIVANGKDFILEHWAIDPDDRFAELPKYWDQDATQYRSQISAKREFWQSRGKPLLETHTGLMRDGREAFEEHLRGILQGAGIRCQQLPSEEIIRQVFGNNFIISGMAELFLQFIQRAKKRGWSADEVIRRMSDAPDKEPRAKLFHQLASRAYREYEAMLEEQQAMDFDDLLVQAAEEVNAREALTSIHLGQGTKRAIGDLRWILLDEYQDFSELYYRMLQAILTVNPAIRLVAVGGDWQAINAFAGAELRFFEHFANYFLGAESVGVTTNYRSDQMIVATGNRLMEGRGASAKLSQPAPGEIKKFYLGDVRIQFKRDPQFEEQWQADSKYLAPCSDGKGPSEAVLRQAQALKICCQVITGALEQKTMLLARTSKVYGLELKEFRKRLIQALSGLSNIPPKQLDATISVTTAHGSKGQEAHTVILLDATRRQFPKVHPDNLLFELFGVTPHTVLEEERRLFYVAMTRAEHRLFVLTNKSEESPYLESIGDGFMMSKCPTAERSSEPSLLGALATKIQERIDALGEIPGDGDGPRYHRE